MFSLFSVSEVISIETWKFQKFLFHWDKVVITYIRAQTHALWGTAFIIHTDLKGTNPGAQSSEQVQVFAGL